jgi:chromosome segregation ATPase
MNIFTRKKKLLAEIANLNEQIRIQSREMASLRKANTDINQLWLDTKKKAKQFGEEREAIKEELRAKGMEYAAELGKKNSKIQHMQLTIDGQQAAADALNKTIAELQDSNSGLASSVSEMKGKLRRADAKIKELKDTIAALRQKQNYKSRPKGPSPYIKPATNDPSNPLDL